MRRVVLLVLGLCCAAVAQAAEVVVVALDVAPGEAEATEAAVVDAIDATGRHRALPWADALPRLARDADRIVADVVLGDVAPVLAGARGYVLQAQPSAAEAVLDGVIAALDRRQPDVADVSMLGRAWAWRAAARLAQGDSLGAQDAILVAIALAPGGLPEGEPWPADLRALYDAEKRVGGGETASIQVRAPVRGATARVDGVPIGALPVDLARVLPGRHHVHVRTPDGRVGHRDLDVVAGETRAVDVPLRAPSLGAVPADAAARGQRLGWWADGVGRAAGADAVVVVAMQDGAWVAQRWHVGSRVADVPVRAASRDALAGAVAAQLDAPPVPSALLGIDPSASPAVVRGLQLPPVPQGVSASGGFDVAAPSPRARTGLWVGVGVGTAAAVALATTLGIVLGRPAAAGPAGPGAPTVGEVVIGPARTR